MINPILFRTAGELCMGEGALQSLGSVIARIGNEFKRVLLFSTDSLVELGYTAEVLALLEKAGLQADLLTSVPNEPSIGQLTELHDSVKDLSYDLYVAIGGGSVLDAAKILSVLRTNSTPLRDMLGTDRVERPGIPLVLIPTTAGTGSEVTPNAIVTLPEDELKVAVVSRYLYPAAAILDPLLTVKLPPAITASTGMDAFTHALESYLSVKANPLSDMYALEAIRLISGSILEAYHNGASLAARAAMLYGSAFAGLALTTAGTAAVHALAYPLGGGFHIPHGVANAMLLPHVTAFNRDAAADRLGFIAQAMGLAADPQAADGPERVIALIRGWTAEMSIPQDLAEFGVRETDVEALALAAAQVTRLLQNNPKPLNHDDMVALYRKLLPGKPGIPQER